MLIYRNSYCKIYNLPLRRADAGLRRRDRHCVNWMWILVIGLRRGDYIIIIIIVIIIIIIIIIILFHFSPFIPFDTSFVIINMF